MVKHVLTLASFGSTATELRKFQLAKKYQLPHRFNKEKKLQGRNGIANSWKIILACLYAPERQRINDFFDQYESILDEHKFTANQIYNIDKTGLSTVHKSCKIIAQKGKHQVGAITSERGLTPTCVCCMNAAGEFVPSMFIFKRIRMNDCLKNRAPPGT